MEVLGWTAAAVVVLLGIGALISVWDERRSKQWRLPRQRPRRMGRGRR